MWILGATMAAAMAGSWTVVNDTVMGGVSSSEVVTTADGLIFSGVVSKENNGGFASIRQAVSPSEFATNTGIRIQATGDDLPYQVIVWLQGYGPRLYYRHYFYPTKNSQYLSFVDFEAVSYGRRVQSPSLLQMRPEAGAVGILMGAGYEGDFQLTVHQLEMEADLVFTPSLQVLRVVKKAIEQGVPAFNSGDAEACAAIYGTTIQAVLGMDLPVEVSNRLTATLETSSTVTDAVSRAWLLRHALDSILMNER